MENKKILEKLYKHKSKENEMKQKFDELKYENLNLNQNLEYNSNIQQKFENLILENKTLKRMNNELNKKLEGYEEGEEMHQNDGEEVHQVHHENEEVEYDGEGQVQGEEEEIEREPEEGEVEEQIQERDSLKKTMTQNIGDEVIEISEYPNNIYYDKENFCDYKP